MVHGKGPLYHKEDAVNLAVQIMDARGRSCWDYRGQVVTEPVEGATPLELRHIVADALGQDKDGPFRPRILLSVLDRLNTSGQIDDEGTADELLAWAEKTDQLTPLIKARLIEATKE